MVVNLKLQANKQFYLRATTMGGVEAQKEIILNITPYECKFTISPRSATIAVPYTENKVIDIYSTINSELSITSSSDSKCPVNQFINYENERHHPKKFLYVKGIDMLVLTLEEKS